MILGKDFPKNHRFYDEHATYIWEAVASGAKAFGDGVPNICGTQQVTRFSEFFCLPPMGPKIKKHDSNYGFNGVQLRDLDKLVQADAVSKEQDSGCQCTFFWASLSKDDHPLTRNYGRMDADEFAESLSDLFESYNGRPYDRAFCCVNLLAGIFPCFRSCRYVVNLGNHQNQFFCSELVATVYRDFGVLNSTVAPENAVPMDFFGFDRDGEIAVNWEEVTRFGV